MSVYLIFKNKLAIIKNRLSLKETDISNCESAYILSKVERWICLSLILLFVVFVRVRLMDVPLERDEGEYAYMGQMLLQGVPPYDAAYSMKFPGTALMYALNMSLFGHTIQGIHLGLLVFNCLTILSVFFLCKKIVNDFAAIIASGAYAVLSLNVSVYGFAAHATNFVILPAVVGALFLLDAVEKNKPHLYFLSGSLFGLAFLMKQHGFFFIVFGIVYMIYHFLSSKSEHFSKRNIVNIAVFIFSALLPLLITGVWLYTAGVFGKFWFWTVQYAARYGEQIPLSLAYNMFKDNLSIVADGFYLLWIISGLGFLVIIFHRELKNVRTFIILFSFFSFLSICPGYYFRRHYFITLLPAISISIGILINYLSEKNIIRLKSSHSKFAGLGLFLVVMSFGIVHQRVYFFRDSPLSISRKVFFSNPFPESLEIARFIESRTDKMDRIAILGSEPQILFYSKRRSATGYIYTYPLMEHHDYSLQMQKEMIHEIESSNPKILLAVRIKWSWLNLPESNAFIFQWLRKFVKKNYHLVGVIDIISPERTVYMWNGDAEKYAIQGPYYVLVFQRG